MKPNLKKALWGIFLVPFVLAAAWLYQLHRGIDEEIHGLSP